MPQNSRQEQFITVLRKISEAISLLEAQKYGLAQKLILQALTLAPKYSIPLYLYSNCLENKNQLETAKRIRKQAFSINICYFRHKKFSNAEIISSIKTNYSILLRHFQLQEFEIRLAIRIANEALDFDTYTYLAKIALGSESFVKERLHTKIDFFQTCFDANMIETAFNGIEQIRKDNGSDLFLDAFAVVCFNLGKYDQCLELINQLRQHNRNRSYAFLLQSKIFVKLNKLKEALSTIQQAVEKNQEDLQLMACILQAVIILLKFFPQEKVKIQRYLELGVLERSHAVKIRESFILKWIKKNVSKIDSKDSNWILFFDKVLDSIQNSKSQKQKLFTDLDNLIAKLGLQPFNFRIRNGPDSHDSERSFLTARRQI